ncbi:hypothetical protein HI13_contig00022-0006 [Edwardsiella piscicida]|nr:hypothetical protein HI13_contig00022-0006 [Edwardsiella piscicida]
MTNHAVTCNASQKAPVDWAIGIKGNTQANGAKVTQNHHPDGFFTFIVTRNQPQVTQAAIL